MKHSSNLNKIIACIGKNAKIKNISEKQTKKLIDRVTLYEYMSPYFLKNVDKFKALELIINHDNIEELAYSLERLSLDDEKKEEMEYPKNDLFHYKDRTKLFYGARLSSSMILNENPKVLFDFSYTFKQSLVRHSIETLCHLGDLLIENIESSNPWELSVVGYDKNLDILNSLQKQIDKFLRKHPEQIALPNIVNSQPHEYIPRNKEAVYISSKAKNHIDGPLDADYYVINFNLDNKNESLSMACKADAQPYCLPIHKYLQYYKKGATLKFNHIFRILKEVQENRGDWKSAFEKHIPREDIDPNIFKSSEYKKLKRDNYHKKEKHKDLVQILSTL